MSDGGDALVVRLAAAEDQDVSIRLFSSSPSAPSLTVWAPAALLLNVPYFATRLTKPWIDSSSPQQIALECTPESTPQAYLQCLLLLKSSPTSWPLLLQSVSEVLQLLPVADHLLFKECWDACMGFLASSPWSIDEEDAIRATISKLNMEPLPDVKERLDTSYDGAVLETLLCEMLTTPSLEASFGTWCEKCLNHSSAPFAAAFQSILLVVMEALSPNCQKHEELSREWYVLAKILLKFTDAQQFILHLVNSEGLLQALSCYPSFSIVHDGQAIFHQVLEKVEKRVVLLSNLQRASLLKWSRPVSVVEEGSSYYNLRLRLVETLPFGDPTRMQVIKSDYPQGIPDWIDQVSHRVSLMDEVGLKTICENFGKKSKG